jgi:hypothetical protein
LVTIGTTNIAADNQGVIADSIIDPHPPNSIHSTCVRATVIGIKEGKGVLSFRKSGNNSATYRVEIPWRGVASSTREVREGEEGG